MKKYSPLSESTVYFKEAPILKFGPVTIADIKTAGMADN